MTQKPKELLNWIAWKSNKDDLSRKRVITFVRYYNKSQAQWIFTGIYEVNKKDNLYKIKKKYQCMSKLRKILLTIFSKRGIL